MTLHELNSVFLRCTSHRFIKAMNRCQSSHLYRWPVLSIKLASVIRICRHNLDICCVKAPAFQLTETKVSFIFDKIFAVLLLPWILKNDSVEHLRTIAVLICDWNFNLKDTAYWKIKTAAADMLNFVIRDVIWLRSISASGNDVIEWHTTIHTVTYTVSQKNCTPKAGRHKFIKISSPVMIFHTRHCHSVTDQLNSKSLVRVEYQLQGIHGNQAPWQTVAM